MTIKLYEKELPYGGCRTGSDGISDGKLVSASGGDRAARRLQPARCPRSRAIAQFYQSYGYHAFVLRYRLLPNLYPAALCDVQRLIKYLRANGVPFEMHIFPNGPHGLGLGGHLPDIKTWAEHSARWIGV